MPIDQALFLLFAVLVFVGFMDESTDFLKGLLVKKRSG